MLLAQGPKPLAPRVKLQGLLLAGPHQSGQGRFAKPQLYLPPLRLAALGQCRLRRGERVDRLVLVAAVQIESPTGLQLNRRLVDPLRDLDAQTGGPGSYVRKSLALPEEAKFARLRALKDEASKGRG